jgi:predicted nucleotidyltransferase
MRDAQGRVLGTLARTTAELTLTTPADLSGVSLAHVARIVPRLVDLGVVERRDVPPAALVRLIRDNLAARGIVALADLRYELLDELRTAAQAIEPAPVNVTLFGSFARGDDDAASDIDVVVVRPASVDEDDPGWSESIARWASHVRRVSGNPLNYVEVVEDEVPRLVGSRRPLWGAIVREGITLRGRPLGEIEAPTRA